KAGGKAMAFERDMTERTRAYWKRDVSDLRRHARELGLDELLPWDATFVQESLRMKAYDIDDEALRPYFPLDRVMDGMFGIVERVFGLTVKPRAITEVWH